MSGMSNRVERLEELRRRIEAGDRVGITAVEFVVALLAEQQAFMAELQANLEYVISRWKDSQDQTRAAIDVVKETNAAKALTQLIAMEPEGTA